MRKMFLRTLVVASVLWVVACMDDSTSPSMPQFDHIPGRIVAFETLEAQIIALFPEGQGRGGRVQSSALTRLRNIDRQLLRNVNAAQRMAFGFGQFAMGQLNAGNLQGADPAGDLAELIDALSFFVGGEGGFALEIVPPPPPGGETTVTTDNGHASVIIDDEDLSETILVSIQQIVEESCGLETDLVQSAGCWRFDRFPGGDFDNDVEVTICVDDEDVPTSLLPFLRLHKGNPGEPIQALVATAGDALICDGFEPLASLGSNSLLRFARAVSSGLRTLLGPQPLSASAFAARGLGGLTGSFTDFGGVVLDGILVYGPSMLGPSTFRPDNEQTFAEAEGFTVTVADATEWGTLTTADFASFRAIVFGDRGGDVLGAAEANKAVWSAVITGPVIISALNPQIHQCDIVNNALCQSGSPIQHKPEAVTLIKNGINFAASGSGTGAYISLDTHFQAAGENTPISFLSEVGAFEVVGIAGFTDVIDIVATTHPAMATLTNAGLSGWFASNHQFLQVFPTTYTVLAQSDRVVGIGESSVTETLAVIVACSPGATTDCVVPSGGAAASAAATAGQSSNLSKIGVPANIR